MHVAAGILPPTICPALRCRENRPPSQRYFSLAASVSEIPRHECLKVSSMLPYVLSKGMARKHVVWSQESPSTSSRLMVIRKSSALWPLYCYHDIRFESMSKPILVCGYRQYGAIPQSVTNFGSRCQVYTSSSTSKSEKIRLFYFPSVGCTSVFRTNVLLSIIATSSLLIIMSKIE
jgi:hypothetical protein